MKKYLLLVIAALFLVACSNEEEKPAEETEETEEVNESEEVDETEDEGTFENDKAEVEELAVEIIDVEVIKEGEGDNQFNDGDIVAFTYEATNKSDEEITLMDAWYNMFTVIQDNDDNVVNELDGGVLSDEDIEVDNQLDAIKEGGTAESTIAFVLDDDTTPVTLIAQFWLDDEEIGREEYDIK